MNSIQLEATQGAVFAITAHTDAPLTGAAVTMTVVQGNCLDSAVSAMGAPGAVLAALTSSPAAGLTVDAGAGSFTLTLCYAIPGTSAVTGFLGRATSNANQAGAGAGGLFNPPPAAAVPSSFLPFFWA